MIRDSLVPARKQRYPNVAFSFFDTPQPFARVASGHSDIGDLEIFDDGDEATVAITEITHSHFNPYKNMPERDRDEWVTNSVIEFLDALFGDRVLLYRTTDRRQGGWQLRDEKIDRSPPVPGTEQYECFVWSGAVARGR